MTKEEKVLWATWMASTDIWEYAVDIFLDFTQMMDCELNRIWKEGLRLVDPDGDEFVAFPIKSYDPPRVIALIPDPNIAPDERDEGWLIEYKWENPDELDELIVAKLKSVGFIAPWVNGLEVKSILFAKWGRNWNHD